jgi:hypothetical protein
MKIKNAQYEDKFNTELLMIQKFINHKLQWNHLQTLSFTPLVSCTPALSLHSTVMLIKPQHIISYCDKIFQTIPEVQTLLQHLYDLLQSVRNE